MKQILYSPLPSVQTLLKPGVDIHDTLINGVREELKEAIFNLGVIMVQHCPDNFENRVKQALECCANTHAIVDKIIKEQIALEHED